jgi:hypothetical protein
MVALGMVVDEVAGEVVVEVAGGFAERAVVVGGSGRADAFGLPSPQAATTTGSVSRPTLRIRRMPFLEVTVGSRLTVAKG